MRLKCHPSSSRKPRAFLRASSNLCSRATHDVSFEVLDRRSLYILFSGRLQIVQEFKRVSGVSFLEQPLNTDKTIKIIFVMLSIFPRVTATRKVSIDLLIYRRYIQVFQFVSLRAPVSRDNKLMIH